MIVGLGQTAWQALSEDLGDMGDPGQLTSLVLRTVLAAAMGWVLGWQREKCGKSAGERTHMLVAVGAATFVLVPQQMGMDNAALSRVIQGLLAGIGFLGAGAILKLNEEKRVQGLTTAASIWVAAAIGMTAGLGRGISAVLVTGLAFVILEVVLRLEQRAGRRTEHDSHG